MEKIYWGEIHTHTYCGGSKFGDIEQAVKVAKTHLDFWAPGEHYNERNTGVHPMFDWDKISRTVADNNEDGRFVAFPGMEFVGEQGDYNVYFNRDFISLDERITNYERLFSFAGKNNAIVIPHHTGYKVGCRGMQWDWFDPSIMPAVEIFSMHGSSEDDNGCLPMNLPWMGPRETGGTAVAGLKRGKIFGFLASSDGHSAYPGAYKMGLTAVYAERLDRQSVWNAILNRKTYAVTGDRILLDFKVNGNPMGTFFSSEDKPSFEARAECLDAIEKLEVIKNGSEIIKDCYIASHKSEEEFMFRIEWGWGGEYKWEGAVSVEQGEIIDAVPCFGPPGNNVITGRGKGRVSFSSFTDGKTLFDWKTGRYDREGTNSLVLKIKGGRGVSLTVSVNGKQFSRRANDLSENSHVELLQGPNGPKIKFHKIVYRQNYARSFSWTDDSESTNLPVDFYYLRLTQKNGQMVWSSPIWIKK